MIKAQPIDSTARTGTWPPRSGALLRFSLFTVGATSIASLLLYFSGLLGFAHGARFVLLPGIATGVALIAWSVATTRADAAHRILGGLFAGILATFLYDLCRVPIAHGGIPVFKAISYFGTILLDQPTPTFASEAAGWAYHLSNGVGFGLMYAALVSRPRWWTAVLWGLFLEAAMLVTPYAEVFGYKIGSQFLAITIGAHVMYGLSLYAGLRLWETRLAALPGTRRLLRSRPLVATAFFLPLLGISAIAADFHGLHAQQLAPSPLRPAARHPCSVRIWGCCSGALT